MKLLALLLLLTSPLMAAGPSWQEETKPLWHHGDEAWLKWPEHTRPMRDDRPLWKKMLSSIALWTDARDIRDLASTAPLGERIRNYEVVLGIKFTIFF